ncbi:hypothetical protein JD844_010245 [Phrynosoma platyrhinos]|uniref:UDENN domain-containing protein n=1 Tax=Phrynosoma platyrhinos TaxID=52577 RepID=A0ABQ7TGK3_PHRPL|nr:hypothetical protein JD844_010245 [Phrynosoma platyrhinos]
MINGFPVASFCSYLPWFEIFYKILNYIADNLVKEQVRKGILRSLQNLMRVIYYYLALYLCSYFFSIQRFIFSFYFHHQLTELNEFLSALHVHPVPDLSSPISLEFAYFIAPDHGKLPTIPENVNRVRSKALEDVVILNIDTNTMESPFQDLESLPSDIISLLKFQLKKQSATTGDGVARAFLRAQALLFGSYREALVFNPGEPISFSQDSFLQQGSSTMQAFFQRAVHLQLFKEFIEDRLEKLNAGKDFCDLFEQEINRSLSPGTMHAYHLWMENLKKGGGALISTMKNKANPAVRSAYQYAKGHAKTRLKNMRSRLMDKESSVDQHQQPSHSLNCDHISSPIMPTRNKQSETLQSRLPITQHFGKRSVLFLYNAFTPDHVSHVKYMSFPRDVSNFSSTTSLDCSLSPDEGENLHPDVLDSGNFDLLGEIFETLNLLEPSQARQPLYGTRSLDFSNLDEKNFYMKTLYEPLSEEQDDGESLSVDRMPLASLDQENMQSALLLSMGAADQSHEKNSHGISASEEVSGPKKAPVPLLQLQKEEEEKKMAAPDNSEVSYVAWTQNIDQEASYPIANRTESHTGVTSVEESRAHQILDSLAAFPSPETKPPVISCSSIRAPAVSFQTKVSLIEDVKETKETIPVFGQVTSPQHPLAPRSVTQPRVSELKKRFET